MLDAEAPRWAARPRPVPDARLSGFAGDADLTKAWVLQLVAGSSLDRVAVLDLGAVTELGPGLCAAVVAALDSDAELRRLEAGGDVAELLPVLGRLTGVQDPAAAAGAVEALRTAVWAELRAALRRPSAELVGALAERLAHVCAVLTQTVLGAHAVPPPGPEGEVHAYKVSETDPRDGVAHRPDSGDRRAGGWPAAVRRALQGANGAVVSVLAVDVDEADRLLVADEGGEVARALARVERMLAAALDADGGLVVVAPGRYGATLQGVEGSAARAVGERLAGAVGIAAAPRGVPLRASVGLASSPADGRDAATLIACAEERAVAARASGVTLT